MKNLLLIVSLCLACFIFSGCPYEATVPIDEPSVKISPQLIGAWLDNKNDDTYTVSKLDDFKYRIEQKNKEAAEKEIFFAYTSMLNGIQFLNIWKNEPDDSLKRYSFYKLEIKPDQSITLSEVTENIEEHFSWSYDLKKFIIANMNNSYFFGKEKINLIRSRK